MARPVWTGYLGFGLVSVPVAVYSATHEHEVRFHQFQRGTSDRIRNKRVNERTGREVDYDDIVKGHELGDGEYVIVEPEELDDVAPGRSKSMEIATFVELADIDPMQFQKSYYLGPADEENSSSYALLREALAKTGHAAVVTFVMRGKEYLGAVRSADQVLVLETMYFADEIRDPVREVEGLPPKRKGSKQLSMAVDLIEAMSGPWDPDDYRDTYTDRVRRLVEDKRKGKEAVVENEPEATNVSDLLAVLQASVEEARMRRGGKGGKSERGAGKGRGGKGGNSRRRKDAELEKASKAELRELARKLDVKGRSTMTRDELIEAVSDAGAQRAA